MKHKKLLIFRHFSLFFHVCSKAPPGAVCRGSHCQTFISKCFLVPFLIFMVFKKAPFGQHFRQRRRNKRSAPNGPGRTSTDPDFHEIIVITVPFGPDVFFLNHLFDKDLLIFGFFYFCLCYVLYAILSHLLIIPQ